MKRLDPATGKPFKCGDVREDGRRFWSYRPSLILTNGYCGEKWLSPESFQRHQQCNVKNVIARRNKQVEFLQEYKLKHGCADCGYNAHYAALQFDHLPGTDKKFTIAQKAKAYTLSRLKAEIAKCEVVCANCHAIRTTRLAELCADSSSTA